MKAERSKLRTAVAALVFTVVGILLLVVGGGVPQQWLRILLFNFGSFVLASVVISLVFEFWQLRIFLEELFEEAKIAEEVRRSRILSFSTSFHDGVEWERLFERSTHLDLFFTYGYTWRNTHQLRLERMLSQRQARLGVVLPDRENAVVMAEMAQRLEIAPDELARRIEQAEAFFRDLASRHPGEVTVYALARSLTFTFYRFNTKAVFTTYRHSPGRGEVITMTVDREGEFYQWLRREWYGVTRDGVKTGITRVLFAKAADRA